MRIVVRIALVLLAAAFVGGFVWIMLSAPTSDDWVGKPAPPTHGTDAKGSIIRLDDSLGKVVMLDFWGNW